MKYFSPLQAFIGLSYLFFGLNSGGGVNPKQWTFPVTPQGSPFQDIQLLENSDRAASTKLSLRATLVFDGERCFSKIVMPELESWLIKKGGGQFEWKRIGGGTIVFKNDKFKAFGTDWKVQRHVEHGKFITTIATAEDAETYEFSDCFLRTYMRGGRTFALTYDEDGLVQIQQIEPFEKPVLLVTRSADRRQAQIQFQTRMFKVTYNARDQIEQCVDNTAGKSLVEYKYSADHLLQEATLPEGKLLYAWALPTWIEWYEVPFALTPVIASDSFFSYQTKTDLARTVVNFHSHNGQIAGRWIFNPLNGDLQCTFTKGDFIAVQALVTRK